MWYLGPNGWPTVSGPAGASPAGRTAVGGIGVAATVAANSSAPAIRVASESSKNPAGDVQSFGSVVMAISPVSAFAPAKVSHSGHLPIAAGTGPPQVGQVVGPFKVEQGES